MNIFVHNVHNSVDNCKTMLRNTKYPSRLDVIES